MKKGKIDKKKLSRFLDYDPCRTKCKDDLDFEPPKLPRKRRTPKRFR